MGKNIVFCADGTWNGPGEDPESKLSNATNVFKLFCNLKSNSNPSTADDQELILHENGKIVQIAKYLHGVGDSENPLIKLMGGGFGAGIIARIVRGYTFISRNYNPGDKIYIVGFSRGAYTARALAGFISAEGLIDSSKNDLNNRNDAYMMGLIVWCKNRENTLRRNLPGWLKKISDSIPKLAKNAAPKLINATIAAVGVWDTVGALGIPVYAVDSNTRMDLLRFADNQLSPNVSRGFHAISIDEQRADFTPTLWDKRAGIEQLLFPGAHADVGGGYPGGEESCLSDIALVWMMECLKKEGVLFSDPNYYSPCPKANGTAHQPWIKPPWNVLPQCSRIFPDYVKSNIDRSVDERRKCGPVKDDPRLAPRIYNPQNI